MAEQLWSKSAGELAALIATGETSSREVVDAHLDRIAAVNGRVNAVVEVLTDQARASADAADAHQKAGKPLGRLHGVPFTIKTNIDYTGSPTHEGADLGTGTVVLEKHITMLAWMVTAAHKVRPVSNRSKRRNRI